MGYKYHSGEERRNAKKARNEKRKEIRKQNRQKASSMASNFMYKLISRMKETGFSNLKLTGYSGVCAGTLGRLLKKRDLDKDTFIAVVGMARAAGYKLELVRLSPQEDEYYNERTVRLSDVEKLKGV